MKPRTNSTIQFRLTLINFVIKWRICIARSRLLTLKKGPKSFPGDSGLQAAGGTSGTRTSPGNSGPQRNKKAPHTSKYCQRCHNYGGAERTHNTNECKKYEKSGNLLPTFKSKARRTTPTRIGGPLHMANANLAVNAHSFAQLKQSIETLGKAVLRQDRHSRSDKKRKRGHYHSRHDSEMSVVSGLDFQ